MNTYDTYDVYIETDNQVKGTRQHVVVCARSHEQAMDIALEVRRLCFAEIDMVTAIPRGSV